MSATLRAASVSGANAGATVRAVAALCVVVGVVLGAGCTHVVTIASSPPGATVLVGDKAVGKTPYALEEHSGRDDLVPLEVQQGGKSAHFAYKKTALSNDALIGSVAGAGGLCLLGGTSIVSLVFIVPGILLVAANPALGVGLIVGAYLAYAGGLVFIANAPYALVLGIGEGARQGPDRIDVDFDKAVPVVTSHPAELIVPLAGHARQRY